MILRLHGLALCSVKGFLPLRLAASFDNALRCKVFRFLQTVRETVKRRRVFRLPECAANMQKNKKDALLSISKCNKKYTILPKGTSIKSLKAGSKKFLAKWKKQVKQTTGYQIQYSTGRKFTSSKIVAVKKRAATSRTISKLSGKKKYYVRIRTYKTVSGKNYYSAWSRTKYVTTKR